MSSALMVILLIAVIVLMVWLRIVMPNIKGKMGKYNVSVILSTLGSAEKRCGQIVVGDHDKANGLDLK